jgi:hypothetical protein
MFSLRPWEDSFADGVRQSRKILNLLSAVGIHAFDEQRMLTLTLDT